MRTLLMAIVISQTPALAESRWTFGARFSQRTESSPVFDYLPSGATLRYRAQPRLSLSLDVEGFDGATHASAFMSFPLAVDARRTQLPVTLAALLHAPRGGYVIAGGGATHEHLLIHFEDHWIDMANRWRPHAFAGVGLDWGCANDRVTLGLELRGIVTGGTAPSSDDIMPAPTFSTYALQATLTLALHPD